MGLRISYWKLASGNRLLERGESFCLPLVCFEFAGWIPETEMSPTALPSSSLTSRDTCEADFKGAASLGRGRFYWRYCCWVSLVLLNSLLFSCMISRLRCTTCGTSSPSCDAGGQELGATFCSSSIGVYLVRAETIGGGEGEARLNLISGFLSLGGCGYLTYLMGAALAELGLYISCFSGES